MKTDLEQLIAGLSKKELDEVIQKAQEEKAKKGNINNVYYFYFCAEASISVQADSYDEAKEKLNNWMAIHSDEDIVEYSEGFCPNGYDYYEEDTVKYPPTIK